MSKGKKIFSVSEINKFIHTMFDQEYSLKNVCVEGEVSNLKSDAKGHLYFSLKDDTANISCNMFAFRQRTGLRCQLQNGIKVIVTGKISVFEKYGTYYLYSETITPGGIANMAQRFEELKKRLTAEGLFDISHRKQIPKYCKTIGVVTAQNGAVIHDIYNVAHRRNPYVQIILCHAKVQGDGAAQEIAESIRILDSIGLDCIIVGRGGGSTEELWAFNEEIVARAVYECETPIISAVGHDINYTLCDLAADDRAPTPSAAAEIAVFDLDETLAEVNNQQEKLTRYMKNRLDREKNELLRLKSSLVNRMELRLNIEKHGLSDTKNMLYNCMSKRIRDEKDGLREERNLLYNQMKERLDKDSDTLSNLKIKLNGLDPKNTLALRRQKLEHDKDFLSWSFELMLSDRRDKLESSKESLQKNMAAILKTKHEILTRDEEQLKECMPKILQNKREILTESRDVLQRDMTYIMERKREKLKHLSKMLISLSPDSRMTGGYAYACDENNKPLTSVGQITSGDLISLKISDGEIKARVERIIKKE